ncbi:MAG: hypothetical protein ABIM36_00350 [candidate division WOR-3 bacterium]
MKNFIKVMIFWSFIFDFLYGQEKKFPYEYIPKIGDLGYGVKVSPKKEKELYTMKINPVTPPEGIETGHVILYGHYIKRPYKLEIKDDTLLFLNGIQIFPPLEVKARKYADSVIDERIKKDKRYNWMKPYIMHWNKIIGEARVVYKRVAEKQNLKAAKDSVIKFLKEDPWVKEGKIEISPGDTMSIYIQMRYVYKGKPEKEWVTVLLYPYEPAFPVPKTKEEKIESKKRNVLYLKREAENTLKEGRMLHINGLSGSVEEFYMIVKILRSTSLTPQEKIAALSRMGMMEDDVKLIFYNFDPLEYPSIEELEKEVKGKIRMGEIELIKQLIGNQIAEKIFGEKNKKEKVK